MMTPIRSKLLVCLSMCSALPSFDRALAEKRAIEGPSIGYEAARFSEVRDEDGNKRGFQTNSQRWAAELFAPVKLPALQLMLVPQLRILEESRSAKADSGVALDTAQTVFATTASGLILVPMMNQKTWQPFAMASRYGGFLWQRERQPLAEYVIGSDFSNLACLTPSGFTSTKLRLAGRHRRYPGNRVQYLPIFGYKLAHPSGYAIDLAYPSNVLLLWTSADFAWQFSTGLKIDGREYPHRAAGTSIWVDGHTRTVIVGLRGQAVGPLHVGLEAGVQQSHLRFYDNAGERLDYLITDYAPWAQMVLQTVIVTE